MVRDSGNIETSRTYTRLLSLMYGIGSEIEGIEACPDPSRCSIASTTRPEDAIHVQSWLYQSDQQGPLEERYHYLYAVLLPPNPCEKITSGQGEDLEDSVWVTLCGLRSGASGWTGIYRLHGQICKRYER